jgi:hypothetical protein
MQTDNLTQRSDIVLPCLSSMLSTGLVYWSMDCTQPSPARKGERDYNALASQQV